jgi:hypothetical protein
VTSVGLSFRALAAPFFTAEPLPVPDVRNVKPARSDSFVLKYVLEPALLLL